jgi:hypothetical protein
MRGDLLRAVRTDPERLKVSYRFAQPRCPRKPPIAGWGVVLFALVLAAAPGCSSSDRTFGIENSLATVAAVATVTISPTSATISPGKTRQFSVTLKDAAGHTLLGRVVSWKSSNPLVATVSSTGLVKALKLGSTVITATSEGKSRTASVTVKYVLSWIWSTGFETDNGGMNLTASTHNGGSVSRVKTVRHAGLYSLKFTTPAIAQRRAAAFKRLPFTTGIHIADVWFKIPTGQSSNTLLEVTLEGWSGTQQHLPAVNWIKDAASNAFGWRRYVNGSWQYIPGGQGKGLSENVWHHLVLEVDYTGKVYRKLTVDNTVFPLTDLPYDAGPRTASPSIQETILLWTTAPTSRTIYVDDVKKGILR